MLDSILAPSDCARCKICCKFQTDELFDAPTFSYEEKSAAMSLNANTQFSKKGTVFQIQLIPYYDKYICPMLSPSGCLMGDNRPFDCKSWPFYLMKLNNRFIITLSLDCPVIANKSVRDVVSALSEDFIAQCYNVIEKYPEMITDYNREMLIIKFLESVE